MLTGQNLTGSMFSQVSAGASQAEASVNRAKMAALTYGAAVTGAMTLAGGAMIKYGVEGAMQLQNAMATVGIVTGATARQLESLRGTVMDVSGRTAQDAVTIAQEMAMSARMGIGSPAMLQRLFPSIAMFADTRYLASGGQQDPVEAVRTGTAFAHYFRTYGYHKMGGQPDIDYMLDQLNRVMNVQGEDMTRLLNQGKYFIPMMINLLGTTPKSINEIMDLLAIMGQTGFLRGRGGSGMGRVLMGAINATASGAITTSAKVMRYDALYKLGLVDANNKPLFLDSAGNLQFEAMMGDLLAARKKLGPIPFATDVYKVFGMQGSQILSMLVDPQVVQQEARAKAQIARQPDMLTQQQIYLQKAINAWQLFATNWRNIWTNIFYPTLPKLSEWLTTTAHTFDTVAKYFKANPDLGFKIAMTMVVATVAAGLATIVQIAALAGMQFRVIQAQAALAGGANPALRGVGAAAAGRLGLLGWIPAVAAGTAGALGGIAYKQFVTDPELTKIEIRRKEMGLARWDEYHPRGAHVTIQALHLHGYRSAREQADAFLKELNRRIPVAVRSTAGSLGHPRLSTAGRW